MRFIKTLKNLFGLPAGYTRLEYLASNGNQYIDTEYVMSDGKTMGFESDMMWTQSQGNANFFYGYRSVNINEYRGDMRTFFIYGASPEGRLAIRYGVDSENSTQVAVSLNDKCKMTFDGTNLKVNGITYATHSQAYSPADYKSMWLFNCNATGYYSTDISHFIGRIYRFKIFEDGVTVRDFVPCLDSFGKPCMYDLIERKAYYNKGTEEFTYGRQIIPVKYLQSSGNQYIDTGIKFDGANTKIEVKTYEDSLTRQHSICGDDGNYFYYFRGTGNWAVGYNGTASNIDSYMSVGDNVFVIDKNNVYVNDVLAKTYTASSTVSSYNTLLFNRKTSLVDKGAVTIYYCKIWNNDTLVRDYIPAKDENGIGFLFDKVNNDVYLNAGSDAFITGDNVYQPLLRFIVDNNRVVPAGFTEVEYLESTTGQYIDTGVGVKSNTVAKAVFSITSDVQGKSYFGARNSTNERFQVVNSFGVGAGYFHNTSVYPIVNKRFEIEMRASGEVYLDGIKRDATNGTFSAVAFDRTLYIFHTNYYDGSGTPTSSKFWKVQILEGDTLVRDYIPALDPSGRPCMYDRVEGKPYYNLGTGEFSYGKQIIPVEYLEFTGTQGIDTGYIGNLDTSYEIIAKTTQTGSAVSVLFGSRSSASSNNISTLYAPDSANVVNDFGNYNSTRQSYTPSSLSNKLKFYNSKNKRSVTNLDTGNYNEVTTTYSTDFTTPNNLYIGLKTSGYVDAMVNFSGYVYGCKIWDNNTLVRDFIPCKDENSVGYMLDKVNHVMYENKGTGSFITGNTKKELTFRLPKDPIPREYQIVSYLESSGTQYIDTLWTPTSNNLKASFRVQSLNSPYGTAICGAEKTGITARWVFVMYGQSDEKTKSFPLTGNWNNCTSGFTFENGSLLDIDWTSSDSSTTITDNLSKVSYTQEFGSALDYTQNDVTLKLFCNSTSQMSSIKMYKYKIWDNGILVRNFVPVLRKSDSVAGMYDIVTKQFFENQGTGTFNYG